MFVCFFLFQKVEKEELSFLAIVVSSVVNADTKLKTKQIFGSYRLFYKVEAEKKRSKQKVVVVSCLLLAGRSQRPWQDHHYHSGGRGRDGRGGRGRYGGRGPGRGRGGFVPVGQVGTLLRWFSRCGGRGREGRGEGISLIYCFF